MNPWSGKREGREEPLNALIFKVMERVCPLNTRCDDEKTSRTPDKPQTASERASERARERDSICSPHCPPFLIRLVVYVRGHSESVLERACVCARSTVLPLSLSIRLPFNHLFQKTSTSGRVACRGSNDEQFDSAGKCIFMVQKSKGRAIRSIHAKLLTRERKRER